MISLIPSLLILVSCSSFGIAINHWTFFFKILKYLKTEEHISSQTKYRSTDHTMMINNRRSIILKSLCSRRKSTSDEENRPRPKRNWSWARGVRLRSFVLEVAKQHDIFSGTIAFGELVSARASFRLHKKIQKLSVECLHDDLPKAEFVRPTVWHEVQISVSKTVAN